MTHTSKKHIVMALAAFSLVAAPASSSVYWDTTAGTTGDQGGTGNWTLSATNWWNGSANVVWNNTLPESAVLRNTAGTVSLTNGVTINVNNLDVLTSGYTISLGTASRMNVNGAFNATNPVTLKFGSNADSNAQNVGIQFRQTTMLGTDVLVQSTPGYAVIGADGASTTVTFKGHWRTEDGTSKSGVVLKNGATFVVGAGARINNNMADAANARPWRVFTDGNTNNQIVFEAGFDADISHEYTMGDGLSTFRLDNGVTWVTNASQNLPTIYKRAGIDGNITHHGVIALAASNGCTWRVQGSAQTYDGQTYWSGPWTLDAQSDLTHDAHYHTNANVALWGQSGMLTKKGPAALIVDGDHGYRYGTSLRAEEGTVRFVTDALPALNWDATAGQYLNVDARGTSLVKFEAASNHILTLSIQDSAQVVVPLGSTLYLGDPGAGVGSLTLTGGTLKGNGTISSEGGVINTAGTVAPGESVGSLSIVGNYTQTAGGTLIIEITGPTSLDQLNVTGTLTLGGALVLDFTGYSNPQAGTYHMFSAGSLTGAFDSITLQGLAPSYRSGDVMLSGGDFVVAVPLPSALGWAGLGLLGLLRRRRQH